MYTVLKKNHLYKTDQIFADECTFFVINYYCRPRTILHYTWIVPSPIFSPCLSVSLSVPTVPW